MNLFQNLYSGVIKEIYNLADSLSKIYGVGKTAVSLFKIVHVFEMRFQFPGTGRRLRAVRRSEGISSTIRRPGTGYKRGNDRSLDCIQLARLGTRGGRELIFYMTRHHFLIFSDRFGE